MTGITSSLESLGASIVGILKNILHSFLALFGAFGATAVTAVSSAFELFKAILNFLITNIFLMLLIAAGFFGYTMYLQRQRGQIKLQGTGTTGRGMAEKGYIGHSGR